MTNSGQPGPLTPASRRGCGLVLGALLTGILGALVLSLVFNVATSEKPAPDFPSAQKAELTSQGNQFVDGLYQKNKREGSSVKVFLTSAAPEQVLEFYNSEFVTREGFNLGERPLQQLPNGIIVAFSKKESIYALITSNAADGLVKNQMPGQTYIIVAQGRG